MSGSAFTWSEAGRWGEKRAYEITKEGEFSDIDVMVALAMLGTQREIEDVHPGKDTYLIIDASKLGTNATGLVKLAASAEVRPLIQETGKFDFIYVHSLPGSAMRIAIRTFQSIGISAENVKIVNTREDALREIEIRNSKQKNNRILESFAESGD